MTIITWQCEMTKGNDKVTVINREALLPDRHPNDDFFVCDIFDCAPKSDTASMEYPLFTLSTKPDYDERLYKNKDNWLKLSASPIGLATVHDRDILIYCISQCMSQMNKGEKVTKTMRFQASDLLKVTNRQTSGQGYKLFSDALRRLQGTQIETNITTGGKSTWDVFSFIDKAKTIKETREGRMQDIEITLSDWVFNAIQEKGGDILTISRDYFRLRKPLERRLYEIARKHCGTKNKSWAFLVSTLHEKTGSKSPLWDFRRMLLKIIDNQDHIPDYSFSFEKDSDKISITPKTEFSEKFKEQATPENVKRIILKTKTYETAKRFSKGLDVYFLEQEWLKLLVDKDSIPSKPDGSFINFVKWYAQNNN